MHVWRIAVLAAIVIGLSGCGGDDASAPSSAVSRTGLDGPTTAAAPQTGESTGATGQSSAPGPSSPPTATSTGPQVIVKGSVEAGPEAGCLLLGGYSLVVDSALWHSVLVAGEPVEVAGYLDSTRSPSCQVGRSLVVTDVRPE